MIEYRYKEIKCPKCGRSHFRVKRHNTDFGFDIVPAIFTREEDEEYKDGVLQNPQSVKPAIEKFKCLECGCNFRTETYPANGDVVVVPNIINEDEEENYFEKIIREHNEEVAKQQENQAEATITGAKSGDTKVEDMTGITNLEDCKGILTYESNEPTIGLTLANSTLHYRDEEINLKDVLEKIDNISERLEKMEKKLNDK